MKERLYHVTVRATAPRVHPERGDMARFNRTWPVLAASASAACQRAEEEYRVRQQDPNDARLSPEDAKIVGSDDPVTIEIGGQTFGPYAQIPDAKRATVLRVRVA